MGGKSFIARLRDMQEIQKTLPTMFMLPTLIQEGGNISNEPNMALNSFTKDEIGAINKIMTA